ncbi:MAG: PP2C family protein-serine/threonine phosphatase [Acidobacteriaceae bacterium]
MGQARGFRKHRLCGLAVLLALFLLGGYAQAQSAPTQSIPDLGRGTAALDDPWQFHLGDNASWASPDLDDATGHSGWSQIAADKPWGAQGYRAYVGYAWYRKHLDISPASGASPNWSMLVPHIDDVYAIYWNGKLLATHGTFPPDPSWHWSEGAQTFDLGPMNQGVLAVRVYKYPLGSYQDGLQGGFYAPPVIGSAQAISREKSDTEYLSLQHRQFAFAIDSLEALVLLLSFLFWWRDRSQRVLLWTALYCLTQLFLALLLTTLHTPLSFRFAQGIDEPLQVLQDVTLWFLLLWLLDLRSNERVMRWTRALVWVNFVFQLADGATCFLDWSRYGVTVPAQMADAIFTTIYTVAELWPIVLVILAVRNRLDRPRWAVAIFAFLSELTNIIPVMLEQGSRFTHWTIGQTLHLTFFTLAGTAFDAATLASTGLLLAIIYGVFSYSRDAIARRQLIEQELKSAQELQQVLIPEHLPSLPGFAVTSGYRPAQEVGGDFFQIIPLEETSAGKAGSSLIVLGDVSGKGLRAAMTVSLIVGSLRTLAETTSDPAEILAGLNRRLCGRLHGGFTTCLAVKLDADGSCTLANAGHPSPFLNRQEVATPGALPLGVTMGTAYEATTVRLRPGDHVVLYTDGLLEARNAAGELFGFDRLCDLITARPDAAQSIDAAVRFGQQDDITVLTLTRLGLGEEARIHMLAPALAPA